MQQPQFNQYRGNPQNTFGQGRNINRGPNPERFLEYEMIPNKTGFKIPNCDFIFYFDQDGGWYDEHHNYYDQYGQPRTPPEEDDFNGDYADYDDAAEKLAREYEMGDEDYDDEHLAHYDNLYLNIENKVILEKYLKDQEVHVEIRNMNFRTNEDEFEGFLKSKKIEWIEFTFEYDLQSRFKGICNLVLDKPNAEKLIQYNSTKFAGRDMKINVLKPDEEEEDITVDVVLAQGLADVHVGPKTTQEETKDAKEKPVNPRPIEQLSSTQPPVGAKYLEEVEKPQLQSNTNKKPTNATTHPGNGLNQDKKSQSNPRTQNTISTNTMKTADTGKQQGANVEKPVVNTQTQPAQPSKTEEPTKAPVEGGAWALPIKKKKPATTNK